MEKNKLQKFGRDFLIPVVVVFAGFIFIALGLRTYNGHKNFTPTTAVITDITETAGTVRADGPDDIDYEVTVEYSVEGKTYAELLGEYRSSFRVGDEVEILYNPQDPKEIQSKSPMAMLIQFGFGAFAVAVGAVLLFKNIRKAQDASSE